MRIVIPGLRAVLVPATMGFMYLLAAPDPELELAQAELWALAGCEARGRVAETYVGCDVTRAAYVSSCLEVLAEATSLEELCEAVRAAAVSGDCFRIDTRVVGGEPGISSQTIAHRLADALTGAPDLDNPRVRFLAVIEPGRWRFGRVVSRSSRGYHRQSLRPHHYSLSLSARHARALVNLVAAPGDTLLDMCCGVGTCVIEARAMGVRAFGCDISRRVVAAARENLDHFGLAQCVFVADARHVPVLCDAAIVDFPYGHSGRRCTGLYQDVLNNAASQVSKLGVVTAYPAEELFAGLGLIVVRRARVPKNRLTRFFYVLECPRALPARRM